MKLLEYFTSENSIIIRKWITKANITIELSDNINTFKINFENKWLKAFNSIFQTYFDGYLNDRNGWVDRHQNY
ncbi:MAG: hypothetical protein ABJA66_17410 [Actinomycetota bacterium]